MQREKHRMYVDLADLIEEILNVEPEQEDIDNETEYELYSLLHDIRICMEDLGY